MTARKLTPSPPDQNALQVQRHPAETEGEALASAALRPTVQAALTLRECNKSFGFGETSLNRLVEDLGKQCELASQGDLKRAEAQLAAQAHTLDTVFHSLVRRATTAEYLSQFEAYLRLGLKAQSQCRATLEALALLKNPPPTTFVRQANVAHGPQQVNNAPLPRTERAPRAREFENRPNELLEQQPE